MKRGQRALLKIYTCIFVVVAAAIIYLVQQCYKCLCSKESTDSPRYSAPIAVTSYPHQNSGTGNTSTTIFDTSRQQKSSTSEIRIGDLQANTEWNLKAAQTPMTHQESPYNPHASQSSQIPNTSQVLNYSIQSNNPQPSAPYLKEDSTDIPPNYNEAMILLSRDRKESQM